METINSNQAETPAGKSLLEWGRRRLQTVRIPLALVGLMLAIVLVGTAGLLSVHLSESYYQIAPYHYDSAAYRMQAIRFHETLITQGRLATFLQALQTKDGLDLSLRTILAPSSLLHPYGHLAVLLPFMGIWLILLVWYVFARTNSLLLGASTVMFIFAFPLIYNPYMGVTPYQGGIADYWKDNLATWLFGSAVITWMLSNNLARPRWAFLCGFLLGLLVMQRSALAVYAAILYLPLFCWAVYQRISLDGLLQACVQIAIFVAPAALLGGLMIVLQWHQLYQYYFVTGYSYGTPVQVARYLFNGLAYGVSFAPIVMAVAYLFCVLTISYWKPHLNDIMVAGWITLGFPLAIIISSAYYFGFYAIWPVLLVIFLSTLLPRTLKIDGNRLLALSLLVVSLISSAVQYHISAEQSRTVALNIAYLRRFYHDLASIIIAQPEPRKYGIFFDEVGSPFLNQAFFDEKVLLDAPIAYMMVHDTYYRVAFGDLTAQEIADQNVQALEHYPDALAIGYCDATDVLKYTNLEPKENPLAVDVAIKMNSYLLRNPHWQVFRKLDAAYGCLYAYRYSPQALTEVAKWQGMVYYKPLTEIPLSTALAPGVRMYNYASRYVPEEMDGIYYQWLPSGRNALYFSLFSDQARTVIFKAHAAIGPARKDNMRTLIIANAQQEIDLHIGKDGEVQVKLNLQPGLNKIEMYVQEAADLPQQSGDARELMLRLASPRFVPDYP